MNNSLTNSENNKIKINAVSQITGIPVDTLRAWERRYEIVKPVRNDGSRRLYSDTDIETLTLAKLLVDRGHAISSVAKLNIKELKDLLALHENKKELNEFKKPISINIVGNVLSTKFKYQKINYPDIQFLGSFNYEHELRSQLPSLRADVLIIEYASLQKDHVNEIKRLADDADVDLVVIVYGFTAQHVKNKFKGNRFLLRQAPIEPNVLVENILTNLNVLSTDKKEGENDTLEINLKSNAPRLKYTKTNLAFLASLESPLKCECPQHISDLILSLNRFEEYSADCENKNDEDAEIHEFLKNTTGHSRRLLEIALNRVIEHENIELLE